VVLMKSAFHHEDGGPESVDPIVGIYLMRSHRLDENLHATTKMDSRSRRTCRRRFSPVTMEMVASNRWTGSRYR